MWICLRLLQFRRICLVVSCTLHVGHTGAYSSFNRCEWVMWVCPVCVFIHTWRKWICITLSDDTNLHPSCDEETRIPVHYIICMQEYWLLFMLKEDIQYIIIESDYCWYTPYFGTCIHIDLYKWSFNVNQLYSIVFNLKAVKTSFFQFVRNIQWDLIPC